MLTRYDIVVKEVTFIFNPSDELIHLEMRDLFSRYANDVIATSAYGIHCDSLNEPENEFYKMGLDVTDFGGLRMLCLIAYLIIPRIMRVNMCKTAA